MIIGIDFREAAKPTRAGKGEYVFQVVRGMLSQLSESEELVLLVESGQTTALPQGRWRMVSLPGKSWLWQAQLLAWLTFAKPFAVYFASTSIIVPALVFRTPVVTTLFDFTAWRFPKTHLSRAVRIEKLFMAQALSRSAKLLAISSFTKQEAVDLFQVDKDRIEVTLLAAETRFQKLALSPEAIKRVQDKYGLPNKFLFYLGTLEPRKNLHRLVEAYLSVLPEMGDNKLVLAGGKGWNLAESSLSASNIVSIGYIDDEDKAALYNLSTGFVFPSIYEGFGLPPLEAMSCGVPVITSDTSSLPEVVGGAALLVNPLDTSSLAGALVKLVSSTQLRASLSQLSLKQARQFSWDATAKQTLSALREASHG